MNGKRLVAALFPLLVACDPGPPVLPDPAAPPPVALPGKPAPAQAVQGIVKKLDEKVTALGGSVSAAFVRVGTGEILGAANEHAPKNPASNAKLPTVAAALALLGPGHRFSTGLYGKADGAGHVPELVLRSHGDPTLRTEDLAAMARELTTQSVTKVDKVLVDQSWFDDQYVPPAFDQQPNEWAYFRAPVAAVSLDENTVTIYVRTGAKGERARITVDPPGFVDVEGFITTGKKSSADTTTCEMSANGDRLKATLGGKLAEGSRLYPIVKRVEDPRRLAGYALVAVLREQGVEVGGEVALGGAKEKHALATHASRPLLEIVDLCGKDSDNFVAEMLFRAVGEGTGKTTSTADGARVVTDFLEARGALDGGKIVNGSGLFDANRATAAGTTKLLAGVYGDPKVGPEFLAHLSIGGVDGTLKGRFEKWGDARVIRAKTGTLAGAVALSGYILSDEPGAPIAFSILVNGINGKQTDAKAAIDDAVDAVAALVWK
ncbi:MAG: D-alanyl-D-alanine carboxypeptidase/D-alanyl-D-alanine-endopeptidase [Polyangiaceae bacterium]